MAKQMIWAAVSTIDSGKGHLWRESDSRWISECGLTAPADNLQPNDAIGRCKKCTQCERRIADMQTYLNTLGGDGRE